MDAVIVDAVRTAMRCGRPDTVMTGIPASWLLAELFRVLAPRTVLGGLQVDRILLAAPLEPDGADVVGRTAWREAMRCGPAGSARGHRAGTGT